MALSEGDIRIGLTYLMQDGSRCTVLDMQRWDEFPELTWVQVQSGGEAPGWWRIDRFLVHVVRSVG